MIPFGYIFGIFLIFSQNYLRISAAAVVHRTGCYHNGTVYADGSMVPTLEPCLSCRCNGRTLICSLKICPEMPVPPPRGCVLVQNMNGCCPYLSCIKYHAPYGGSNRRIIAYLDHFEKETLERIVNENVLQKRSDDSDLDGSGEICVQNGTVYKSGSAMSSSGLCSYCYCIGGVQKCVKPKCMLAMEGCKPIFVESTCCPVRYDCTTKSSGIVKSQTHVKKGAANKHYQRMSHRLQRGRGCTIRSQFYPEGQKMPTDPDKPCDICFCIRGVRKCAPKKCSPALRNCVPVVPKGQCCPSSYECGYYRDIDRGYLSRQFDLFSFLFGPDDVENATHASLPTGIGQEQHLLEEPTSGSKRPTNEKTIFDAIKEGLEYIDNNEGQLGTVLGEVKPDLNSQNSGNNSETPIIANNNSSTVLSLIDDGDEEDINIFEYLLGDSTTRKPSSFPTVEKELITSSSTTTAPYTITPSKFSSFATTSSNPPVTVNAINGITVGHTIVNELAPQNQYLETTTSDTTFVRDTTTTVGTTTTSEGETTDEYYKITEDPDTLIEVKENIDDDEDDDDDENDADDDNNNLTGNDTENDFSDDEDDDDDVNIFDLVVGGEDILSTTENGLKTTDSADFDYSGYAENEESSSYVDYPGYENTGEGATENTTIEPSMEDTENDENGHEENMTTENDFTNMSIDSQPDNTGETIDEATKDNSDIEVPANETSVNEPEIISRVDSPTTEVSEDIKTSASTTANLMNTSFSSSSLSLTTPTTVKWISDSVELNIRNETNPYTSSSPTHSTKWTSIVSFVPSTTVKPSTKEEQNRNNETTSVLTAAPEIISPASNFSNFSPSKESTKTANSTAESILNLIQNKTSTETNTITENPLKEDTSEDFLSALFSGLSTLLGDVENETLSIQNISTSTVKDPKITSTEKTSPSSTEEIQGYVKTKEKEDLPIKTQNHTVFIYSSTQPVKRNISQTTVFPSSQKTDLNENQLSATDKIVNIVTPISVPSGSRYTITPIKGASITQRPIVIKTNPSILEADLELEYNEPTLPPSLPNLKIIPFLPTDAVKNDRKQSSSPSAPSPSVSSVSSSFDYYQLNPSVVLSSQSNSNYAPITERPNHEGWGLNPITKLPTLTAPSLLSGSSSHQLTNSEYDTFNPPRYPSFVEKHDPVLSNYPYEDHKKYPEYRDYVEYPDFDEHDRIDDKYTISDESYDGEKGQFPNPIKNGNVQGFIINAIGNNNNNNNNKVNGFSPPKKTEGGFLPKDPIKDVYILENFHTTKFLMDLTTPSAVTVNGNTNEKPKKGVSTVNPFKDVIKTEPPPDLNSLIEDKEKLLATGMSASAFDPLITRVDNSFEKDIISITTDSSYNSQSDTFLEHSTIKRDKKPNTNSTRIVSSEKEKENAHKNAPPENIESNSEVNIFPVDDENSELANVLQKSNETSTVKSRISVNSTRIETPLVSNSKNITSPMKKNSSWTTSTQKPLTDLTILKDVLLSNFGLPNSEMYKPKLHRNSTHYSSSSQSINNADESSNLISSEKIKSTTNSSAGVLLTDKSTIIPTSTLNPFLSEPFNKLPFINPSFPVRPSQEVTFDGYNNDNNNNDDDNPLESTGFDFMLNNNNNNNYKNDNYYNNHTGGYEILPNESTFPYNDPYVINPVDIDKLAQHKSEGPTQIFTKPNTFHGNLKDPAGILKLAGCNIYGRMYRVGRIISELSGPCLECKCTEIGVNCTPLDC